MARLSPISRKDFIKRLKREWNWEGPYQPLGRKGGKHPDFLKKGKDTLNLPNQHGKDPIGTSLLGDLLDQAGISRKEWTGDDDDSDDHDEYADSDDDQPDGSG